MTQQDYVKITTKNAQALRALAETRQPLLKATSFKVGILDNPQVATYAAYNEFGWVQAVTGKQSDYLSYKLGYDVEANGHKGQPIRPGMTLHSPPRPFLRGTAAAKKEEWRKALEDGIKVLGLKKLPQILENVARQAQVDVQTTIKNNGTDKQQFPNRSSLTKKLYGLESATTSRGRKRKIEDDAGAARDKALIYSGRLLQSIGYEVS